MEPTFRWASLTGASSYELEVADGTGFSTLLLHTTTSDLLFVPSSALPAGDHYWRVRKAGGNWSPAWPFTIPVADPPAPDSPANGADLLMLDPSLSWSAVSGATGYQVQLGPDDNFLDGVQTIASATNHLELHSLARDAHYWWRVRAKVSGVFGAWSGERSFNTPSLEQVSLISPDDGASVGTLPTFDWSDVTGATGYRLQVSSDPAFSTLTVNMTVANSIAKLSKPLPSGTWYWRVRPIGPNATPGPWSATRSVAR
jgi:hypothetical protein